MTNSRPSRRSKIAGWTVILVSVTLAQVHFSSAFSNSSFASAATANRADAISAAACRWSPRNDKHWSNTPATASVSSASGISCSSAIALLRKAPSPVSSRNVVRLRNWRCNPSGSGGEVIYTKCVSRGRTVRIGYGL